MRRRSPATGVAARSSLIRSDGPAFTLIELLVVVAIISVLMAILLPSLRAARSQGKRVVCQSNLREILKGWALYVQEREYGGRFLKGVNVNVTYGGQQGSGAPDYGARPPFPVQRPLNPYLGLEPVIGRFDGPAPGTNRSTTQGPGVFACPVDEGGAETSRTTTPYVEYYGTSYKTNVWLVGQDQIDAATWGTVYGPCLDALNQLLPAQTVSKLDVDSSCLVLIGDMGWWDSWSPLISFDISRQAEWHDKRGHHNLGFLDGHADFVRLRKGIAAIETYNAIPPRRVLDCVLAVQEELPD